MSWAEAVPNLLIGLRAGLAAGLLVSLLLAVHSRSDSPSDSPGQRRSAAPIWLGVLGAVTVSTSVTAVGDLSSGVLSPRTQQVVSGALGVLTVILVTSLVRRTGGKFTTAALALTAFVAVGRGGLETTRFLWSAVRAAGQSAAPLVGAALGLAAAAALCWLLYRCAARSNRRRLSVALLVIAAGVLAAGLGDLQQAGVLPGRHWTAFDLSAQLHQGSWWVAIGSGASELTPRMTVLQVVAWVVYLAVLLLVLRAEPLPEPTLEPVAEPEVWGRRPRWLAAGLIAGPALVAAAVIAALPGVAVTAAAPAAAPSVNPATLLGVVPADLAPANQAYQGYVTLQLQALTVALTVLGADLDRQDLPAARRDWLTAQLAWERVGASYNSFGDAGVAIDGLPLGLPGGAADPSFTGLHRLEYGLWHQQSAATLRPILAATAQAVTALAGNLGSEEVAGDPATLPLRAHEILEDALRDHLSGLDDQGSGATYPMVSANAQVTAVVLAELDPLLATRAPELAPRARRQLAALHRALAATQTGTDWLAPAQVSLAVRQRINAAVGAVLETLARVPDLLEVRGE